MFSRFCNALSAENVKSVFLFSNGVGALSLRSVKLIECLYNRQ